MKYFKIVTASMMLANLSYAGGISVPTYLNQKFETESKSCEVESHKDPVFYISTTSNRKRQPRHENLRLGPAHKRRLMGRVAVGTIVFLHPQHVKRLGQKNYSLVQIGQQPRNSIRRNRKLRDNIKGYLYSASIEKPDNWLFKVKQSYSPGFASEPDSFLNNKTLQVYKEGNSYFSKRCCIKNVCKSYPIFNVIHNNETVGQIAFNPGIAGFLKEFVSFRNTNKSLKSARIAKTNTVTKSTLHAPNRTTEKQTTHLPITSTSPDTIVCTRSSKLRAWDSDLKKNKFKINRFSVVKPFQGWGENKKTRTIRGRTYKYVKVQTDSNRIAWVAKGYLKNKADCPSYKKFVARKKRSKHNKRKKQRRAAKSSTPLQTTAPAVVVSGCCRFPTLHRPTNRYWYSGPGASGFKSSRRKGKRWHAANDLHRPAGEPMIAAANGTVIRKYHFKSGTYAIEVKFDNGLQALYGEVSKASARKIKKGLRITKGQHFGKVSKRFRMLHFELYKGTIKGQAMASRYYKNKFKRRADLINPTSYLRKWDKNTFAQN